MLAYSTIENIGIVFIGLGLALAFRGSGYRRSGGAGDDRGAVPRIQPFALQEPALLRRRRGAGFDRRAPIDHSAGLSSRCRRPRLVMLVGCVGDFRAAAAQRLRLGMDDLAGGAPEPRLPPMGSEASAPGGGRALALSAALAAACFVRAFGIPFLGRPRSDVARAARGDRSGFSLRPCSSWRPVSARRRLPGVIDAITPGDAVRRRRAACRRSRRMPGCRSSRSRRPQLLQRPARLAVHCGVGDAAAICHPSLRLARIAPRSRLGLRRARSFAATQYSGGSFAQPIRRVFGTLLFRRARANRYAGARRDAAGAPS